MSELRGAKAHAAAIEVAGLSHVYAGREGQVPALEDIALTVGAGRFVVIVGPSGCGKTSLLMMQLPFSPLVLRISYVLNGSATSPLTSNNHLKRNSRTYI